MNLEELRPQGLSDMEYLQSQLSDYGWRGLAPSALSDDALLRLSKDLQHTLKNKSKLSEEDFTTAPVFVALHVVLATGGPGKAPKTRITHKGYMQVMDCIRFWVDTEIVTRIAGEGLRIPPKLFGEEIRKYSRVMP